MQSAEINEERVLTDGLSSTFISPSSLPLPWQSMVTTLRHATRTSLAMVVTTPFDADHILALSRDEKHPVIRKLYMLPDALVSFCERVAQGDELVIDSEVKSRSGWLKKPCTCAGVPLKGTDGKVWATLLVVARKLGDLKNEGLLGEFKRSIEAEMGRACAESELERLHEELEEAKLEALTLKDALKGEGAIDPLTGLLNRPTFEERYAQEIFRHKRSKSPLSLVMGELDRLEEVTELMGRECADALLVEIADLLKDRLRRQDLIWRWEGHAIAMLLPETPLMGAAEVVESVRQLMEKKSIDEEITPAITLSAGVTSFDAMESRETCLDRCSELLTYARENGRNRVILG